MNTATIFTEITSQGIALSLTPKGTLSAIGDRTTVDRLSATIKLHKAELIDLLTKGTVSDAYHSELQQVPEPKGQIIPLRIDYPVLDCQQVAVTDLSFQLSEAVKEVAKHHPLPEAKGAAFHAPLVPPPEAVRCFKIGFPWLRDHLDELLAAGWTRKILFGRGRYKWPYGNEWGVAWASSWQDAHKTPGLGSRKGEIVFSFMVGGTQSQQTINLN